MKKFLLISGLLLNSIFTFSQLYVSPSSYVFVNNQFLYVKQDVELQNNANLFLRNNSQLLQGSAGAGTNKGQGKLSVFQEGTVNNFQYNYWCSPVGNASGAAGNEPFGITMIHQPTDVVTSTPAIILPNNNYNGTASPLAIAPYWIWRFITASSYGQWSFVGSATAINPGEGFSMKGTGGTDATIAHPLEGIQNNSGSGQRYDFRGKPNDGTIVMPVANANSTLIGNPYPSAIDLYAFLMDPDNASVINGQAYFYEQVPINTHTLAQYQGGYGIFNPATGIYTPAAFTSVDASGNNGPLTGGTGSFYERRFVPIGQGFMVRGRANGNVTMKNSFRVYRREGAVNNSQFARITSNNNTTENQNEESSEYFPEIPNVAGIDYTQIKRTTAPYIRIHAMYNNIGVRPTTIAFLDNATDGFDYGADGQSPSSEANEFYYVLPDRPFEYIATAIKFDIDKRIPVGFRCAQPANFKIQVKEVSNFDANQNVYLYDKETQIYHDIKNGFFDMQLPAGNNKTRFEITFKNTDETLTTPDEVASIFNVYQNNTSGFLTIANTFNKEIASLSLYDVTGKLVMMQQNLGTNNTYEFSTSNLSDGIYVVKATTSDNLELSKKVSIYKK